MLPNYYFSIDQNVSQQSYLQSNMETFKTNDMLKNITNQLKQKIQVFVWSCKWVTRVYVEPIPLSNIYQKHLRVT